MSRAGKALKRALIEEVSVSVEVAGQALGIKRSSAYAAIRNKELPFIKIGRRIAVPTAAIRRMLQIEDPRT
jgi:excisionase family DNA binding protein